ncbi:MAG: aspartyl protease family protein, partial [Phycisphaerales bacterium]
MEGRRFDGIIGTVLLYHFLSTLDYPKGELVLRRRTPQGLADLDEQTAARRTYVVPFWMAGKHWMVTWGKVNGRAECLMHVDTGMAGGGFGCSEATLKEVGIDLAGLPSFNAIGGGGTVKVTPFTVDELALGKARQFSVPALYGGKTREIEYAMGFRIGATISHGFFRAYALTFDFERMNLHLTPGRG